MTSNVIIGNLIRATKVVESDFSKGLAEMRAAEGSAVSEYEKLSAANAIEKATKEQDVILGGTWGRHLEAIFQFELGRCRSDCFHSFRCLLRFIIIVSIG